VIKEPVGGAHLDYDQAAEFLKESIIKNLDELAKQSAEKLMEQRYDRFRVLGRFMEK